MRAALKRFWEWVVSKSGRPLAVLFLCGDDPQSVAIADEIGRSRAGTDRLIVSWRRLDEQRFRGVQEFIALEARRPWLSMMGLRLHLLRRRISLAVIHITHELPFAHRSAAVGLWKETLAYNGDAERFPLDWGRPIRTLRFLRGVPLRDIERPTRFSFLRVGWRWLHVASLMIYPRRGHMDANVLQSAARSKTDGCSVLCLPGDDAAELDRHVAKCDSTEVVLTRELAFPNAATIASLRSRLQQRGVWLVCARGDFKHVLGEGWAPHRAHENGTFCLGARSSLLAFRRDVFLELGGLEVFEQQLPGQGWAALSLRALLRGYKAIYAGDIDARALKPMPRVAQPIEGPPLASMIAACDSGPAAAVLLHRHARSPEFREAYREAVSRLRLPAAGGKRNGKLAPLVEPGSVILQGREPGRRLRLAMLASQVPRPAGEGGMSRVFHLLRRVAENCDLYLFCFGNSPAESQIAPLLESCVRLVLVRPESDFSPDSNALTAGVSRAAELAMRRHLEVLLEDWRIPLVQIEGTSLAAAGSWLHSSSASKIVAAPELAFALHSQARSSPLLGSSRPTWRDAGKVRRRELRYFRRFDCVVTSSAHDREQLQKQSRIPPVRVVENGVDLTHFRSTAASEDQSHVLWVAEFAQPWTMPAFQVLTAEIWPRVRAAEPEAKLTVVAGEDYRLHWRRRFLRRLPDMPPDITVLGHVGDLRPLYERAGVVLALLPAGGAASPRVLEALAMSRAVVATRDACQGLDVEAGRDLLVAEEAQEFAAAVIRILGDRNLRQSLGRQGRLFVEQRFDWSRSGSQQLEIYEELTRKQHPSGVNLSFSPNS